MNNKLITVVLTLVVGIILAGSVLVPVLNDVSKTEQTFTNEGYYHMTKYTTEDEVTLSWSYATPDTLTVNGVDFELTTPDDGNYNQTIIFGTNSGARLYYNHTGCQFMNSAGTASADVSDEESLTVTCSGGTMTGVVSGSGTPATLTATYDYLYCLSEDGPYVMKKAGTPAYMLADSEFIGMGVTTVAGSQKVLRVEGTIDDGATVTQITAATPATYSTPAIVSTAVNGYNDLYKLDKITFTGTVSDTTTNITYSYFVVPAEVTAELSQHLTPGQIALMGAIPIMVIVALLMLAVGAIAYRRAD